MPENKIPGLFTVYYMNQQKVFETRMLLDNKLKTTSSKENQNGTTKRASLNAEAELNPPFLPKLRAKLEGSVRHEKQEKIVDTLEYVNTNSRMLADIMEHCKAPESGTTLAEGDLAYIGDVSLELINEEEIRGIMAIMSGTFDGITVSDAGDLDIGHMMQSFIGDGAAFKLRGNRARRRTPLYAKIPLDGEEMFESGYTIDDLLIGKVGIVGICKGKITPAQMKSPPRLLPTARRPETHAAERHCYMRKEPVTHRHDRRRQSGRTGLLHRHPCCHSGSVLRGLIGNAMRKLVTYNKSQYKALIDQLGDGGFKLMSLLELHGSDQISELLSEKKLVVDVSSLVGLLSGDLQLASKFELLVHQLPFGTLFIGDDKTVNEGAYQLRTMFDDIIECDIEIDKDAQKDKRVKRTLVSLDELEFKQVLTTLESELIGQIEFKRSFESRSRSFRLFNALDEQPVFSLLLLGPSGVGKTEVAKILCEAIAPCQLLPKVNLGNYSSKDSLNSLIGSPRGYMGSEEGELGKKIDSSDAGILLVDEFEKAEPAVWNFFLDLLETGSFTDSQGMEHDLRGFIIVFTTNCPLGKINETFPAELLSRFNLMSHFSKLSVSDKKFFVERYVSMFAKKYRETAPSGLPTLPDDIADRAMMEIDIEATENIRILKNTTRSWISEFVEKARKSSSIATQPSIINTQT